MSLISFLLLLLGIVYAIFGKARISINGKEVPALASAVMRLFAPVLVFGLALLADATSANESDSSR